MGTGKREGKSPLSIEWFKTLSPEQKIRVLGLPWLVRPDGEVNPAIFYIHP
jgi:hypothetical protein